MNNLRKGLGYLMMWYKAFVRQDLVEIWRADST